MKLRGLPVIFFALVPFVVCAQDKNPNTQNNSAASGGTRMPAVSNFPTEEEARASWEKKEPRRKPSSADQGPNMGGGPAGASPNLGSGQVERVTLPPLPKLDYAEEATQRVMPMSPEESRRFADEVYRRSVEMTRVPGGPYKMRGTRMVQIKLSPDKDNAPEKIEVALGMGATVSFVDRAGLPVVLNVVKGFSDAFAVDVPATEEAKQNGSNSFTIEAKRLTGQGNVHVQLAGVTTPVLLEVDVGKSPTVDSHVQFVLPISTRATPLPGDRSEADASFMIPEMQGFVAGIPPEGAVEVKIRRIPDSTAWMYRKSLFVRTRHMVITPGWFRRQASMDGTSVFQLPLTSLMTMSVEGREIKTELDFPFIPAGVAAAAGK